MASGKRKRKQQIRRQAAKTQRERSRQRELELQELAREAERRADQIFDPATPVETVAELIAQVTSDDPDLTGMARLLDHKRQSVDEVRHVAELVRRQTTSEDGRVPLGAMVFEADAAALAGDDKTARGLMDQVVERVTDEELMVHIARLLNMQERAADALDMLMPRVTATADDPDDAAVYRYAIEKAHRRIHEQPIEGECPCGSGNNWSSCCRPREEVALERFADRSGLYALRDAMREIVDSPRYTATVESHVREWFELANASAWDRSALAGLERLAIEHAWVGAARDDDHADDLLTVLAERSSTDPRIADMATQWRDNVIYGLWQVEDPTSRPGLDCIELCTGRKVYVAFAPEQLEGIPRWSVLLGAVAPNDGAWRATGTMMQASPAEADSLIELVDRTVEGLVNEMSGGKAPAMPATPAPFGKAEPYSVYAADDEPRDPMVAKFFSAVTGSLLPRLLGRQQEARSTPPTMTNTDGEVMDVIKVTMSVVDGQSLLQRLGDHPDFDVNDDGASVTWWGREVPAAQRSAMLAEARSMLGEGVLVESEDIDRPQRWVRGTITVTGNELTAEVNSRKRLERLTTIVSRLGGKPSIVDQVSMDPAQDLPWTAAYRPAAGSNAPPGEGWEARWVDDEVPALGGLTPRQAVGSEYHAHLEGMLRQLEYDSDLRRFNGEPGIETDWLRRETLDVYEWR